MLAVGTTTLVSHAIGRKDHERAQLVLSQAILLRLIGILFFVTVIACATRILGKLSPDACSALRARQYLSWFSRPWRCSSRWW